MLRRLLLACCLVLTACAETAPPTPRGRYLGQMRVWPGATLDGTVIGGLSGISYDPARQVYYIISDDRSAKNRHVSTRSGYRCPTTALTVSSSYRRTRGWTATAIRSGRWTSMLSRP